MSLEDTLTSHTVGSAVIATLTAVGYGGAYLVSQAADVTPGVDFVGSLVGSGAGFAFAAWITRHLLTVTVPNLQKQHAEQIDKLAKDFREEQSLSRESHAESITRIVNAISEKK